MTETKNVKAMVISGEHRLCRNCNMVAFHTVLMWFHVGVKKFYRGYLCYACRRKWHEGQELPSN